MVKPDTDENDLPHVDVAEDTDDEDEEDYRIYSAMGEGGATVGNLTGNAAIRWAIVAVMVLITLIVML